MRDSRIIAVDFDGTLISDSKESFGEVNSELLSVLIKLKNDGTKIILMTSRNDKALNDAVDWCFDHGLNLDAVNANLPEVIEEYGYDPRKIVADVYIDDRACTIFDLPYLGKRCENHE